MILLEANIAVQFIGLITFSVVVLFIIINMGLNVFSKLFKK